MRCSPKVRTCRGRLAAAHGRDTGEPDAAKIVESALRRPEPPSANSYSEPSLYVHECPPPRLPIDHPHSAGSVAGGGCRLICRFGGSIGSNARGPGGLAPPCINQN